MDGQGLPNPEETTTEPEPTSADRRNRHEGGPSPTTGDDRTTFDELIFDHSTVLSQKVGEVRAKGRRTVIEPIGTWDPAVELLSSMNSEPVYGTRSAPGFKTIGYINRVSRGTKGSQPLSKRLLRIAEHRGEFAYGFMAPDWEDGLRGAARFAGWPKAEFEPHLVTNYMKKMYPNMQNSCGPVAIEEVLINPLGTAGPCFPKAKMAGALTEYPMLLNRRCHLHRDPVIWKIAGKHEILAQEKIDARRPRTFAFMDFHHKVRWTRLVQDMNKQMQHQWRTRPPAGAISLVDDWHDFWKMYESKRNYKQNDFEKFDAGYPARMHEAVCEFRVWCFAKLVSADSIEELRYYYDSLQYPIVILPNGQVVILENAQLSGQPSTTTDNSLVSSFLMDLAYSILCYVDDGHELNERLLRHALINRHPRVSTKTRVSTGGDDSIAGDNLTSTQFKAALSMVCQHFGFKIKESDYRETTNLSECGFLGGLAKQVKGRYVYTPKDPRKMYDSMFLQKQELGADEEFNKILSLTALNWNTTYFDEMHAIYMKFHEEYHEEGLQAPLSKADISDFWLGAESSGGPLTQQRATIVQTMNLIIQGEGISSFCPAPVLRVNTVLGTAREK
jgi:hypothetical protein